MKFEIISVIGLGYIGLPTAATFASRKFKVIGVDVNSVVVETIQRGEIHILEPDLDMLVHAAVKEGYLRATMTPEPADAFLIAVPTPFKDGYKPDLSYIQQACESIAPVLRAGNLIILESTSPVGSTEHVADWLAELRPDLSFPHQTGENSDIRVAHCPERVLPGRILRELVENDRVIGGMSPACGRAAKSLYRTVVKGACVVTDVKTAELCKLVENSFRDVNIAFANELSFLCDQYGVDVWNLIRLANRHPRVNILSPGPGVGGHCVAVDPWFLISQLPEQTRLIKAARDVNSSKPGWVVGKVVAEVSAIRESRSPDEDHTSIACFGLSFKANVDDLRESPACQIVADLANLYPGQIVVVEPHIEFLPETLVDRGVCLVEVEAALAADVLVLLVDHEAFQDMDVAVLAGKAVLDTRGFWSK